MVIEIIKDEDFEKCHEMIAKTCRISFANHYPESEIEKIIKSLRLAHLNF